MSWIDIQLEEDGTLKIEDGDLVIGDADFQNVANLLVAEKGSLKHDPIAGAGARRIIKKREADKGEIIREISLQIKREGRKLVSIDRTTLDMVVE